jgi:hypothetical protein
MFCHELLPAESTNITCKSRSQRKENYLCVLKRNAKNGVQCNQTLSVTLKINTYYVEGSDHEQINGTKSLALTH